MAQLQDLFYLWHNSDFILWVNREFLFHFSFIQRSISSNAGFSLLRTSWADFLPGTLPFGSVVAISSKLSFNWPLLGQTVVDDENINVLVHVFVKHLLHQSHMVFSRTQSFPCPFQPIPTPIPIFVGQTKFCSQNSFNYYDYYYILLILHSGSHPFYYSLFNIL